MTKTRPTKHKDKNTFKFKTFSERLGEVSVGVIHRYGEVRGEVPGDTDTFFQEALDKWADICLSEGFTKFQKDVINKGSTLSELIFHKDELANVLLQHLNVGSKDYLQPLLEIVVAFAKDLRRDFHQYFPEFFEAILKNLNTRDVECLEWSFTCLAYIYKALMKFLIHNVKRAYELQSFFLDSNQPEHVRVFACEAFALLGKKVVDKKGFVDMLFKDVSKHPERVEGIGQLLFEIVRGVNKKLHSCSEVYFPLFFSLHENKAFDNEILKNALSFMILGLTKYLDAIGAKPLLTALISFAKDNKGSSGHCEMLIQLLNQIVSHQEGVLLLDTAAVVKLMAEFLDDSVSLTVDAKCSAVDVCAAMIVSPKLKIQMEYASSLIKQVYSSATVPFEAIESFTMRLISSHLFESHVLSNLLVYIQKQLHLDERKFKPLLRIVAKLIHMKRPNPRRKMEFGSWKPFPLEFTFAIKRLSNDSNSCPSFPDLCLKFIENVNIVKIEEEFETLMFITYVIPHLRPFEKEKLSMVMKHFFHTLLCHLDKITVHDLPEKLSIKRKTSDLDVDEEYLVLPSMGKNLEMLCLLLGEIASSRFAIDSTDLDFNMVKSVCFRSRTTRSNISLLRVLNLALSEDSERNEELLKTFYEKLQGNLKSPYQQVRLLTLQILSHFKAELPTSPEGTVFPSVFQVCLNAEEVEVSIQKQREKLKFLQKLEMEHVHYCLPVSGHFNSVPVNYLMSQLFLNFRPIWDSTIKILSSHAHAEYFWENFKSQLAFITELSKGVKNLEEIQTVEDELVFELAGHWLTNEQRLDYGNVRSLLWKSMTFFIDIAEKRNRELVPLFFSFLEKEYFREDISVAKMQDISIKDEEFVPKKKHKYKHGNSDETNETEAMEVDDESYMGQRENAVVYKNNRQLKRFATEKKIAKTGGVKLLCAHLSVFSKFSHPRNIYQGPKFRKIIDQFLAHRNGNVQKLALDCLMTYNYKYIGAYKKHLYGLLDDKSFRHDIVLFNIDSESDVVLPEHREGLMPVVMRILYGKIHGKDKAARQAIILRFLGGSTHEEIKTFFNLAFSIFLPFLEKGNLLTQVETIQSSVSLKEVVPLKRFQAALNMIGLIFQKLGNLVQETLPWLLNLLLVIGAHIIGILSLRSQIAHGQVDMVKNLRNIFIQRVTDFFVKFEKYNWSTIELNTIFHLVVSPQLYLLPNEAFASPTPLLKLIALWGKNPRYFSLLAKVDDSGTYPVNELVKLLASGKATGSVSGLIMDIFEKLVTLEDFDGKIDEEDESVSDLPVVNMVDMSSVDTSRHQEKPNFGSCLLSLHVQSVLQYLQTKVARIDTSKKGLSIRDLTVLMRLSEFIRDKSQSQQLVDIIVPAIHAGYDAGSGEGKSSGKKLTESQADFLLSTLAALIENVDSAQSYIKVLIPLLGKVCSQSSRLSLSGVFRAIGKADMQAKVITARIEALNAFDPRRMDEPDFSRRLDAYKEINAELNDGTCAKDMVMAVIYNCAFALKVDEDISLRNSASFCLQNVATHLQNCNQNDAKELVTSHFLPQIRQLIRTKKEPIRHEAISVLATLVQKCCNLHPQLKDLAKLSDPDGDVDFFENIKHLQSHRRARALVKVSIKLKETPRFLQPDTLTQFLMPLASIYLFSENYLKQSHLIDAAIETMNAISKNLPWFTYEKVLRYYLQQLIKNTDYQKQAVRTVVAILDGFHFNLANSKAAIRKAAEEITAAEIAEDGMQDGTNDVSSKPAQEVCMTGTEDELSSVKDESVPLAEEAVTHTVTPNETTATKIHDSIMKSILPQLHRLLTARSKRDSQHKVNRGQNYYPEDEEILRVPLALAMVALLQGLPKGTLERNLPGIFMKICTFLKSRADSIRVTARDTLVKIMVFLGPPFLSAFIRESGAILKRGFQVHVLIFTLHAIVHGLMPQIKPGDFDPIVAEIVNLCIQELFGETSEEKEVAQIVAKVKEAKGNKSYDLLNITAKFVTHKRLMPLVTPFKDVLITTKSHKIIRKIEDCYYHIATGLASNESISLQSELIFVHGIVTESIPQWFPKEAATKEVKKPVFEKPDSFIIQPEPKRKNASTAGKENAKIGMKTHSHIITEFALQLLQLRLKKEKIDSEDKKLLGMLDPFISILSESLASPHNKQVGLSLKCIIKLLCLPLPSIEKYIKKIVGSIFIILNKHGGTGTASNDQFEMVVSAYKSITVIIRDVSSMKLEEDQLRVLLTYAEQSMCDVDSNAQTTGFAVLKAVLGRKLDFPELPDIMNHVSTLAVTSEMTHVRNQCRQLVLQYLADYPLGKLVIRKIQFFLGQLEYTREEGRISALEFLCSVFSTFPRSLINTNAPLFFLTLSARLVNETSKNCTQLVVSALKTLLNVLDDNVKNELFQILTLWLQNETVSHKLIAIQLASVFVEVDGPAFESRLKYFLPILEILLNDESDGDIEKDQLLIQTLVTATKLFTVNPTLVTSIATVKVWHSIQKHLLHSQVTVRLLSARLIGLLFSAFTPEGIVEYISCKKNSKKMAAFDPPVDRLRALALDCSEQLIPQNVDSEIAEQSIKNLLFLFKVATRLGKNCSLVDKETSEKRIFGVRWYVKRIRKEINSEVVENPEATVKRIAAFHFYAAALLDLHQVCGFKAVLEYLPIVLPSILREINSSEDKSSHELSELATLAKESGEFMKQLVGHEAYTEVLVSCRKVLQKKKMTRKVEKSQLAVTNPKIAARLRMKKQANKKEAKKKKIALVKGKVMKRKKLKDVALLEE